jgi:hypothetical protein
MRFTIQEELFHKLPDLEDLLNQALDEAKSLGEVVGSGLQKCNFRKVRDEPKTMGCTQNKKQWGHPISLLVRRQREIRRAKCESVMGLP